MKKSLSFLSLLLAAIFLISGTMLIAYAEDPVDGGETPVVSGGDTPVDGGDTPVDGGETPVVSGGDTPVDGGETPVDGGETPVDGGDTPVDGGDTPVDDPGSYVEDPNAYYDPDPLFYGDASSYDYNTSGNNDAAAGSVTSQTTLYNSSGMTAAEAAPNKWSEIKLDEKTVKTGVADFSAIKSNTETADNGDWILYLGYVLLALSVLGILYFIIATITQRKAARRAERLERRRAASPTHTTAARMGESERRAAQAQQRTSAPAQRTSRFADEAPGYSRRSSSKADTGEVYVPRRAAKHSR